MMEMMMEYTATINDNKKHTKKGAMTQKKLIVVSANLFEKYGYGGVSLRTVADLCGIKAASIYNHFSSKEALAISVVSESQYTFLAYYQMIKQKCLKPEDRVRVMVNYLRRYYFKNAMNLVPCSLLFDVPIGTELYDKINQYFELIVACFSVMLLPLFSKSEACHLSETFLLFLLGGILKKRLNNGEGVIDEVCLAWLASMTELRN